MDVVYITVKKFDIEKLYLREIFWQRVKNVVEIDARLPRHIPYEMRKNERFVR